MRCSTKFGEARKYGTNREIWPLHSQKARYAHVLHPHPSIHGNMCAESRAPMRLKDANSKHHHHLQRWLCALWSGGSRCHKLWKEASQSNVPTSDRKKILNIPHSAPSAPSIPPSPAPQSSAPRYMPAPTVHPAAMRLCSQPRESCRRTGVPT